MLTVRYKRRRFEPKVPFLVFIDGAYAGPLTDGTLCLDVPTGNYDVRLQMGGTLPLGRLGKLSTCRCRPQPVPAQNEAKTQR